eukprot:scaffold67023_cov22-Tisochrysis_lutea.AAC.3
MDFWPCQLASFFACVGTSAVIVGSWSSGPASALISLPESVQVLQLLSMCFFKSWTAAAQHMLTKSTATVGLAK